MLLEPLPASDCLLIAALNRWNHFILDCGEDREYLVLLVIFGRQLQYI